MTQSCLGCYVIATLRLTQRSAVLSVDWTASPSCPSTGRLHRPVRRLDGVTVLSVDWTASPSCPSTGRRHFIATLRLTQRSAVLSVDWTASPSCPSTGRRHFTSILNVTSSPPANILSGSSDSEHRHLSRWSCRCYDGRLGLVADTRPDGRTLRDRGAARRLLGSATRPATQ